MLAKDAAAPGTIGPKSDSSPSATEFARFRPCEVGQGRGLAALADTALASRFCTWKGRSGRRYVFSVYPGPRCPAFRDALLLAAVRDNDGRRRAISICDTGPFPEVAVSRFERHARDFGAGLEFHLHLLARSLAERSAAILDLGARAAPPPDAASRRVGDKLDPKPLK